MHSFCTGIGCTKSAFFHYKLLYMMVQRALLENADTNIAKRPSEYGRAYLDGKYTEFRNRFFGGDEGNLPPSLPIGFSNTVRALGHCKSRVRNFMGSPTVISCEIMLSDAYDFTPRKLDEVLIHEMIHAYMAYSKDIADVKETHGPRFQRWCYRINSESDYRITVTSDTPVTLNEGMANRIVNDGTVMLVAREYSPGETAISRVSLKDLSWAIPKATSWLKKPVTTYACSDGNFKQKFIVGKSKLHAKIFPNSTIDDMIESGIMREIQPPKVEAPQNAILVAWTWYRNEVGYCLVVPRLASEVIRRVMLMQENHGIEHKISVYRLMRYFSEWEGSPLNSSRSIRFRTMPKDQFNNIVTDGGITYIEDV